ncbi:MAG: Ig-like domain-containing protein [Candidatus Lokiarchaeota archaeon]|nr:Ig-like domain-containing protein [Candidatus Harpocratesius repetitus]
MKGKKIRLALVISTLILVSVISTITIRSVSATKTNASRAFSLATQNTDTFTGSVARYEVDYFEIANVEPGLMELSVSWGNSYDIDCYICETADYTNYLARGYTTSNPETCSYNIQTAGTYYIAVRMYTWYASSTSYTATVTYYSGSSGGDTIAPSVSITDPVNGATVSGSISITATASDNVGVDYVQCKVDSGTWVQDSTSPYSWSLDTTAISDGSHIIYVEAYDAAGNVGTDSITINVDNSGGTNNQLTSGQTVTGNLAAQYDTEMWYIIVNEGATSMRTVLTCGSADFDVYGRLGAEPTTTTYDWRGYTSGGEDVTFNNPEAGTWYIMVRSYSGTGDYQLTVTVEEPLQPNPDPEKIAVFFWASDAGAQWIIDEYWGVLQNEGYSIIFNFEDTSDFAADFATVDNYVGSEDTVFFYLFGHGNNDGTDSYTAFAPSSSIVYSSQFRTLMDGIDTVRKAFLIESCHSGGFPEDFQAAPYLAMSTSDQTHNAYAVGTLPNEGIFSNAFFNHVADGYNAVESFYYARQVVFDGATSDTYMQYPLISDYSDYVWFA